MKKYLLFFSIIMLSFLILVGCGKKMVTVTFESNGGSEVSAKEIEKGKSFDYEIPKKVGYTFEGWYTEEETTDDSKFTTTTIVQEDITLYAKWTINKYTISFNTKNGTGVQDITKDYNAPISKPIDPTKIGYIFEGWYSDEALKTAYTFTTMPAENTTLYAKWNVNSYTISFNANGGSNVDPIVQDFNTTVTKPMNPTKDGYNFSGWFTDEELLNQYTFSKMPAEDITLYAKWSINPYTISFNSNGGSSVEPLQGDFDTAISKPVDPVKTGYSFIGWYLDETLQNQYIFSKMPAEDITLYAKWNINSYTISFNSNGGNDVDSLKGNFDTEVTKPIDPIKTGYTFVGWYSDEGLKNSYTFSKIPAENITLYAKWNVNSYTICFNSNEGTSVDSIIQNYSTNVIKPEDPFRTGYTFAGWYSDISFTNPYSFTTMPAGDITLYAKWNINSYTISFNSNEGTIVDSITQNYNTELTKPTDPTKIGHSFAGWYIDSLLTTPYIFTKVPAKDITLYAKWNINSYTISFNSNEGTTIDSITQNYNTEVTKPTDPTKIGHSFIGWYANSSLESPYTFSTMPAEDITLYAKWTINKHIINYGIVNDNTSNDVQIPLDEGELIIQVATGSNHAAALTSMGHLYTWGENQTGQLGNGQNVYNNIIPTEISGNFNLEIDEKIKEIFLGYYSSAALTTKGRVFTWGSNYSGELGCGTNIYFSRLPIEITANFNLNLEESIVQLSFGRDHAAAVTTEGRLFVWGSSYHGELGTDITERTNLPIDITNNFALNTNEKLIQVNLGEYHSSAITSLGRLFMWGRNEEGQLGDNTLIDKTFPIDVTTNFALNIDETIIDVNLGSYNTFAITSENRIFVWGSNSNGALGDDTQIDKKLPLDITENFELLLNEKIIQIYSRGNHTIAITSDGRAFTWGYNSNGELGDGTNVMKLLPNDITNNFYLNASEKIIQVSLGDCFSTAITSDGRIFTWGYNYRGQLGDGLTVDRWLPTNPKYDVINSETYDYAASINAYIPEKIGYTFAGWYTDITCLNLSDLTNMPAENITLYGKWIVNEYTINFESNEGSSVNAITQEFNTIVTKPIDPTKTGYTFAGWYKDSMFTLAYEFNTMPAENITLYAKWNVNQYTITFNSNGGTNIEPMTLNYNETIIRPLALLKTGYTFAGWYIDPELTTLFTDIYMPAEDVLVYAKWNINQYTIDFCSNDGSNVDSITQDYNSIVLKPIDPTKTGHTFIGWYSDVMLTIEYEFSTMPAEDIVLYAKWSLNTYSIDYMTFENETNFVANLNFGETIVDLSLGECQSFALTSEGRILAWGYNEVNQLGDGTNISKSIPVDISSALSLADNEYFIQVATRYAHSAALTSSGRVFTWGYNTNGELGNGSLAPAPIPSDITNNFNLVEGESIAKVFVGAYYSAVLTSNNRLFTWGLNDYGQLGDGSIISKSLPSDITNNFALNIDEYIINVALGDYNGIALTSKGRVFTWGSNFYGQLGDTTNIDKLLPVDITNNFYLNSGITIVDIYASFVNGAALSSNGHLYIWGNNIYGQLGNGGINDEYTPIDITDKFNLSIGETISKVSMMNLQSSMLTSNGRLFTWGLNNYIELIDRTGSGYSNIPIEMTNNFRLNNGEVILNVVLGGYHSSAISSEGNLFTWGYNEVGQLGDGSNIDAKLPKQIKFQTRKLINTLTQCYNFEIASYIPTKIGYTFAGWFSDFSCTIPFTLSNMPAYDLVLYGKWEANSYSISFEENGGTSVESIIQDYDTIVTKPADPTKTGYTFAGWYKDSMLTLVYEFNTMTAEDIVLYANWLPNIYTISFNSNGGTNVAPITQYYNEVIIKPIDPTKMGYTFAGWYGDAALTNAYTFTTMPAENITLYSKWDVNQYSISFNSNGGSSINTITQNYNSLVAKPADPTKAENTFAGWYSDVELTEEYNFTTMPAEDIIIYAKWIVNAYRIDYVTFENSEDFVAILNLGETIVDLSLGDLHSIALTSEGRIFTWGNNNYAQLGDGTYTSRSTPVDISSNISLAEGDYFIQVATNGIHSVALTSNGRIFTWGDNSMGQLGNGSYNTGTTPGEITNKFNLMSNEKITQIYTGFGHSAVLTSYNRLFTWGSNEYGQLGDGTLTSKSLPNDITYRFNPDPAEKIIKVSLGDFHSMVLTANGRVYTWGLNNDCQLGDYTRINRSSPGEMTWYFYLSSGVSIVDIYASGMNGAALTSNGHIYIWGDNSLGQIGDGTWIDKEIPTDITNRFNLNIGETISKISIKVFQSSLITSNGRLFTWGENYSGQLGNGTNYLANVPIEITNNFSLTNGEFIEMITFGGYHSSALTSDGHLFTWGSNEHGQLGNGTNISSNLPRQVKFLTQNLEHSSRVDYNSEITSYIPIKTGYSFSGWYSDIECNNLFTLTNMPANNLVLYGKWDINSYTLSFNSNGGSSIEPITQDYNTVVLKPVDPTKTDYIFAGWYSDSEFLNEFEFTTMPADNITLFAKWNEITYTINFNSNGGSNVEAITQAKSTVVTKPMDPTKVGHTFIDWYQDAALTIPYVFSSMPEENITLYAKWEINSYAISFESNGGTSVEAIVQDYNTTVTKPINPTKESYVFGNWYTDPELTTEYVFSTMPAENIVLYASWLLTISFNSNGGTYVAPIIQAYNTPVTKPTNPMKTGYTFIDWYQDVDLTIPYVFSNMPIENITLYALWEINDYNLTYAIQTQVGIDETIVQMSMGKYHSAALTSSGRVFTWGNNNYGQLGQGNTSNNSNPTDITVNFNLSVGEYIISISVGEEHSSAITSAGRIFTWGCNNYGQLGDGSNNNMWLPIDITSKFNLAFGEKIVYVSLGNYNSSAITSNNRVFTWGDNQSTQLGDGTGTHRSLPVNITNNFSLNIGETITQISLGFSHSAALSSTGRIFTWGLNTAGQLGHSRPGIQPLPSSIMIPLMDDMITQISLGEFHSAALTAKGSLFLWGSNMNGQLGDGTKVDRSAPVYITSFFPLIPGEIITKIDLGWNHSIATTSSNRVFTWGANYGGQLGDGTTIEKLTPTDITNKFPLIPGETIIQTSIGDNSSILTSTGRVYTWGPNTCGSLGNGTTNTTYIPTEIIFYYAVIDTVRVYEYNQLTTAYIPTKPGYTFNGWFSDLKCITPYTFSYMPARNVIIYGKFTAV